MRQQEAEGVYRKHGCNLEKRYHCQQNWCESEAANRLLDFQFICNKKSQLIYPLMTSSLLSLSLPCLFLLFICNKKTSQPDLMQSSLYLCFSIRPHPFILSSALPFIAGFCRYPWVDPNRAISCSLLCHSQLQICCSSTSDTHTHTHLYR